MQVVEDDDDATMFGLPSDHVSQRAEQECLPRSGIGQHGQLGGVGGLPMDIEERPQNWVV